MTYRLPSSMRVVNAALVLLALAWPGGAGAGEINEYWPWVPSMHRAAQFIVSVEGVGGIYALGGDGDGETELVLAEGARVRMSQGYSQLWAVEGIVSVGRSLRLGALMPATGGVSGGVDRKVEFGRASVGGVFRFGDMRIPHLRGDIGVQWTRHHAGDGGMSAGAIEDEVSVVPTLGAGYDRRLHHNVLVGATMTLSWTAVSTHRKQGFHSVDVGVRVGVGW